ncbi:hypothetical protein FKM82_026075 [Ascaphus truei]
MPQDTFLAREDTTVYKNEADGSHSVPERWPAAVLKGFKDIPASAQLAQSEAQSKTASAQMAQSVAQSSIEPPVLKQGYP